MSEKVRQVFASESARPPADADAALYDGFANAADKRLFPKLRASPAEKLAELECEFTDPRYRELAFRYRARTWPDTLDATEQSRWDDYRRHRLGSDRGLSEYDFTSYFAEIAKLRIERGAGSAQVLLDALESWGHDIEASL